MLEFMLWSNITYVQILASQIVSHKKFGKAIFSKSQSPHL